MLEVKMVPIGWLVRNYLVNRKTSETSEVFLVRVREDTLGYVRIVVCCVVRAQPFYGC